MSDPSPPAADDTPPQAPPAAPAPPSGDTSRKGYWVANLKLIAVLLTIWALVSFGCGILFVEQLNNFSIGSLPLGFWFAQQGSIYVFVILILVYAKLMDGIDKRFEVNE